MEISDWENIMNQTLLESLVHKINVLIAQTNSGEAIWMHNEQQGVMPYTSFHVGESVFSLNETKTGVVMFERKRGEVFEICLPDLKQVYTLLDAVRQQIQTRS